jgi:drug/metabolite transporter (DMT)-like permease
LSAIPAPTLAVLALLLNALTWGLSWIPLRWLEQRGLHPLWATALVYAIAVALIIAWRPGAPRLLWRSPRLWWLVVAAGTTNASFNWAVTLGDVVRVVLLFYLMPLWAVLLSRWLLGERLSAAAATRVLLALAGAVIVLWPADGGWPWPRNGADALAILGGFSFALNNVLLRREAATPEEARALAMFGGGVVVSFALAAGLTVAGQIASVPAPSTSWIFAAAGLAAVFLIGNLALQYGAARLPGNTTAAVMVAEVLFASVSAVALGAGAVSTALLVGGALIVLAALLSAWKA